MQCDNFNGTFILSHNNPTDPDVCSWNSEFISGQIWNITSLMCDSSDEFDWQLNISGSAPNQFYILNLGYISGFARLGVMNYSIPRDDFDCVGPNVLTGGTPGQGCQNFPATVTITPTTAP